MKKILITFTLILASSLAFAQVRLVRNIHGVVVVQKSIITAEDSLTANILITEDGSEFNVYVDKKGKTFIIKVNKVTMKQRKEYIKWD